MNFIDGVDSSKAGEKKDCKMNLEPIHQIMKFYDKKKMPMWKRRYAALSTGVKDYESFNHEPICSENGFKYPLEAFPRMIMQGACEFGSLEIIKLLCASYPNEDMTGFMAKAAYAGHLDIVKYFYERGSVDKRLALLNATHMGYRNIISYLRDKGVKLTVVELFSQ